MKNLNRLCPVFLTLIIGGALSCAPVLTENPPSHHAKTSPGREKAKPQPITRPVDTLGDVDFSVALRDTMAQEHHPRTVPPAIAGAGVEKVPGRSFASGTIICVALAHDASQAGLEAPDTVDLRPAGAGESYMLLGRIVLRTLDEGRIGVASDLAAEQEASLPCTLSTRRENGFLSIDRHRYRGSIILCRGKKCTVINSINIEDYLRGVVPLEMGKVDSEEHEALKAQAVAARTFAAKRVRENHKGPFDLTATTADQVYGGADVETPEADSAISATAGLVLQWQDSLADIYYHSTCGGRTAANDEAWDKPPCPYLRSENDNDEDGHPYCAFSPLFEWEESWSAGELSKMIRHTTAQALPGEDFKGDVRKIKVVKRFRSGRVETCRLVGTKGTMECGGDKLRLILRRKNAAGAMLRSGNISIVKNGPRRFTVHGIGYGHGVGMCQMGAIGRAREGQTFDQILTAYFRGTEVRKMQETAISRQ